MTDAAWMTAADASRALGVSRATLYAYVSRGYLRSESMPGASQERRYSRDDVERLRRRTESRRDPDKAAAHALQWGMPILESAITLIAEERLYYRGHDAVQLARSRSVAEVASLVWTGTFDAAFAAHDLPAARGAAGPARAGRGRWPLETLPFVQRAQVALALAAAVDAQAFDRRREGVARTGWRILDTLTRIAAGPPSAPAARTAIDVRLARAWGIGARGADVLRAALILCADHELNVSSFTARCVASAGSHPYAVVVAGLSAIEGAKHGGISARVESLLESIRRTRDVRRALADRLRRGEAIDGFGHPLYRRGDVRAVALFDLLRESYARSPELTFALETADAAGALLHEKPTIDFALAAAARVLKLPPGSPLAIFALGRTIGWIGHAIEQYETGQIIRPRARYVGPAPVVRA